MSSYGPQNGFSRPFVDFSALSLSHLSKEMGPELFVRQKVLHKYIFDISARLSVCLSVAPVYQHNLTRWVLI